MILPKGSYVLPLRLLVVAGRLVAGGVAGGDAVGVPVRHVAAAVHLEDRRCDPLLEPVDPKAAGIGRVARLLPWVHCWTSFLKKWDRYLPLFTLVRMSRIALDHQRLCRT